jgi:hypothetical protein
MHPLSKTKRSRSAEKWTNVIPYNQASQCCLILRQDIGCSANVLEECKSVPAGRRLHLSTSQLYPSRFSHLKHPLNPY